MTNRLCFNLNVLVKGIERYLVVLNMDSRHQFIGQSILLVICTEDVIMNHIKLNHLSQRVLFITDLEKIIGRNRLTLRRWWTAGKFPVPIKLNGNTLVWHMETINYWIEQNIKPGNN